jgi:hypothetical protein
MDPEAEQFEKGVELQLQEARGEMVLENEKPSISRGSSPN